MQSLKYENAFKSSPFIFIDFFIKRYFNLMQNATWLSTTPLHHITLVQFQYVLALAIN